MADITEIAWVLEGPRRGGIRRFVCNLTASRATSRARWAHTSSQLERMPRLRDARVRSCISFTE